MIGDDPDLNAKVQRLAFNFGYKWELDMGQPVFTDADRLILCTNGVIYREAHPSRPINKYQVIPAVEFLNLERSDAVTLVD